MFFSFHELVSACKPPVGIVMSMWLRALVAYFIDARTSVYHGKLMLQSDTINILMHFGILYVKQYETCMLIKLYTEPRVLATRVTLHLTICMLITRWVLSKTCYRFPINEFVYFVRYYAIANGISRFQCSVDEIEEKIIIHDGFKKV